MRTVFITPLLFKKLDRSALRRGESGQAIVLIALVAIGLVAMVGLAIDSGIGYLDATRLQRAADAAALAGVIWLPDNRAVGDARAQLAAEANGVKVACYYDSTQAATTDYNQRCKRASYSTVLQNGPDQLYSFNSVVPSGLAIQYQVTLSKMETRFFLGVLGFPAYSIVRTSTAEYFHRVKFGSSFNYYGSNGVLTDHYMRCDTTSLADCDGTSNTQLIMRGATYQKYVLMRCDQPSPPKPCVGNFWANTVGEDSFHAVGDAYNPIRDGAKVLNPNSTSVSGYTVSGENNTDSGSLSSGCLHTSDPSSWFVSEIFAASSSTCPSVNSSGIAIQNQDNHPDSPNGANGFGSEVVIDVDPNAIYSYSETVSNTVNHTNLNVTIYDSSMNEHGNLINFGVADNYFTSVGNNYAALPPYTDSSSTVSSGYTDWPFSNAISITSSNCSASTTITGTNCSIAWNSKRFICSPGTTGNYCDSATASSPSKPTAARATAFDPPTISNTTRLDFSTAFPDRNNLELTYNDVRMRYSLYGPPPTPAIPSIYQNVQQYLIDRMEVTDMSAQSRDVQYPVGCPQLSCGPATDYQRFCYFIFDDSKTFWDNTRLADNDPRATRSSSVPVTGTVGAGPDYALNYAPNVTDPGNRYSYVCPDDTTITGNNGDVRWNQVKGTPTARWGSATTIKNDRNIQTEILESSPITATPIVTGTLTNGLNISNADPENISISSKQINIWDPITTTVETTGFQQLTDPQQDCRRSAIDMSSTSTKIPGFPMDSLWGHNRIPFNMEYGDPLVNRAWVRAAGAGYYTLYYSFHGWRCDWDFDSNYSATYDANGRMIRGNPLKDQTKMPNSDTTSASFNPSLSLQEQINWANTTSTYGKYNIAFVEGHPGLSTITNTKNILQYTDGASTINQSRDFPVASTGSTTNLVNGFGTDYGLQPYFHLTNVGWVTGTVSAIPGFSNTNAPVRGGAYMLHVQTFSGSGGNQYSVKAEYENPKLVTYTLSSGSVLTVTPVPSVYPLTTMSIFANNIGGSPTSQSDVVFDLAYIPPEYAGTQGIIQLWDPGDVSQRLDVSILKPSTYGPKVNTSGGTTPDKWSVSLGAAITTTISACPMTLSPTAAGTSYPCVFNSSQTPTTTQTLTLDTTNRYYNDQWVFLSFQIPSAAEYASWKSSCEVNGVPENLCYFFQIDYKLSGKGTATDVTTWQLLVQGQPVHLVDNDGQP